MLCERCKIREATIQYIEVVNGVRQEHSLCGQCAKETGFGPVSALFDGEFPFAKILSTLLGEEEVEEDQNYAQIICPVCGTRWTFMAMCIMAWDEIRSISPATATFAK